MNERVMVIGKGAREHALAYRLSRNESDKVVREVLISPGNDATAFTQPCLKPSREGFAGFIELAKKTKPKLIVIGPEGPLAEGLSDALVAEGFCVFAPSQKAAQVESSKAFMKEMATAAQIPTATYRTFREPSLALDFAQTARYPLVVKADGLCAGKGVVISHTFAEAQVAIERLMTAGSVVIEEYLQGVEMSVIALCNEDDAILFAPVRDHKRLLDGDKGPNTGGMGVVGPLPQAGDEAFMSMLKEKFFLPTLSYMRKSGCPFRGALFAGLMVDGSDVRLLEFNARFGDPETQALMYGCSIDLFPMLLAIASGQRIKDYNEYELTKMMPTAAITMAARGYPDSPKGGDRITTPELTPDQGILFFAGVSRNAAGQLITEPGRVLTATARALSLRMAIHKSYDIVSNISFFGAQYRADIGRTLL